MKYTLYLPSLIGSVDLSVTKSKHNFFSFRDNGVKAIENLMTKKGKFDYILLETTGLADPGSYTLDIIYLDCANFVCYNCSNWYTKYWDP